MYHWSPTVNRSCIEETGLQPNSAPTSPPAEHIAPYLCFAPDPRAAWALSGDMRWAFHIDKWDLWQANIDTATDKTEIRSESEIRVYGAIPTDRLWRVGSRNVHLGTPAGIEISYDDAYAIRWHDQHEGIPYKIIERLDHALKASEAAPS